MAFLFCNFSKLAASQLSYLKNERAFNNVKSDPRYMDLVRRIGLPQ
jgi:hypothetical protein